MFPGRRRQCTAEEVTSALDALDKQAQRVRAGEWPASLSGLDQPGLYSWWADAPGAIDLSEGIGVNLREGRIYAGQTGATKWPSGKTGGATLRSRVGRNHLRGRIRGSTFRLTLASALWRALELELLAPKKLTSNSEERLTSWMVEHLTVAVYPFSDPDALAWLEDRVLEGLDPPLNLEGVAPTPLRRRLKELRGLLARGEIRRPPADNRITRPSPRGN